MGPNDVYRYCDPDGIEANGCDGSWGWLTGRIRLPARGCDCHLGLSFERSEVSNSTTPYVTFMSQNFRYAADFEKVKSAFRGPGVRERDYYYYYGEERQCGFSWELENPLALREHFQQMMDYVISVWTEIGGWSKLA